MNQVHEGYQIIEEQGTFLPQRFSKMADAWVNYTKMEYGRRVNVSYKTKQGAVNFLDIEWFKDLPYEEKAANWKSGNVSQAIRKAVRR